jgi:hypothetical protein
MHGRRAAGRHAAEAGACIEIEMRDVVVQLRGRIAAMSPGGGTRGGEDCHVIVSPAGVWQSDAYRPIFMIDQDGSVVARYWAVGFMLGIGLRSQEWAGSILLTEDRSLLTPILVYHDLGDGLQLEMPPEEKRRRRVTAYQQIPQAVAAIRAIALTNPSDR